MTKERHERRERNRDGKDKADNANTGQDPGSSGYLKPRWRCQRVVVGERVREDPCTASGTTESRLPKDHLRDGLSIVSNPGSRNRLDPVLHPTASYPWLIGERHLSSRSLQASHSGPDGGSTSRLVHGVDKGSSEVAERGENAHFWAIQTLGACSCQSAALATAAQAPGRGLRLKH
jgi:hypothetical protein